MGRPVRAVGGAGAAGAPGGVPPSFPRARADATISAQPRPSRARSPQPRHAKSTRRPNRAMRGPRRRGPDPGPRPGSPTRAPGNATDSPTSPVSTGAKVEDPEIRSAPVDGQRPPRLRRQNPVYVLVGQDRAIERLHADRFSSLTVSLRRSSPRIATPRRIRRRAHADTPQRSRTVTSRSAGIRGRVRPRYGCRGSRACRRGQRHHRR